MCEYCNTTKETTLIDSSIIGEEGIAVSLNAKLGDLIINAEYDSGCLCDSMTTHIHYCPMCGRKLK